MTEKKSQVTASLVIEDLLLMVLGYENGSISLNPLSSGPPLSQQAQAHGAAVTCFLSNSKDSRRYLISGSNDFGIKVWLIRDKSHLDFVWKFDHHTGPISYLISPSTSHFTSTIAAAWKNCFFSISEDKTIGLYSIENMNK